MRNILLFTLALMSFSALSNDCNTSISNINGLTPESKNALVTACEASKVKPKESMTILEKFSDPDQLSEISHIAKVAGQTVREVANELNVASNEFIKSPVGMITAGLAIWYVTGDTIMAVIKGIWDIPVGFLLMYLSYFFTSRIYNHILAKDYVDVEQTGWFGKKYTVKRIKSYRSISDRDVGEFQVFVMIVTAIGGIALFITGVVLVV